MSTKTEVPHSPRAEDLQACGPGAPLAIRRSRWSQFWVLTKPRIVQLIVFCALIGMLLALPGWPDGPQWVRIALACLGIWLVASAAAAFNCLVEKRIDARMQRTTWRPTARGEVPDMHVLLFLSALCVAGCLILWHWANPLTMWLTLAAFAGYAVVYTVVLKPMTPQNIVLGGASGAMPPVLGWAAMRGEVAVEAWLLFLIIFVWTPPHFWALALYRVDEYRSAGVPMLPVTHGRTYTCRAVFRYTLALMLVCALPAAYGMGSWLYLCVAMPLSLVFCAYGWRLCRRYSDALAMQTFRWSLWHLAGVFTALLIDHFLL